MKLISAIVGVLILIYLSIKHHHEDLFHHDDEVNNSMKDSNR